MFTGIIRLVGRVVAVGPARGGMRLDADLAHLADTLVRGDSVALNGACLTVSEKNAPVCAFDLTTETVSRTTLGAVRTGDPINVEPSLRVGDPLGGHFVLGHVDGVGTIASIIPDGQGAVFRITVAPAIASQMVPKGSVAVDGVSLTVVEVAPDGFSCALIPTTLHDTTLGSKKAGSRVNIETDILGKFVAGYLRGMVSPGVTLDKLREAGFA